MRIYIDPIRSEKQQYEGIMSSYNPDKPDSSIEQLEDLVEKFPDFLDSYSALYGIYQNVEDFKAADVVLNRAYNRALILILENDEWPDKMEWKEETNQPLIRVIFNKAMDFWMDANRVDAKEILEQLIKINPSDEIGARFYLLAIKQKFDFEIFVKRFMPDGYLDPSIEEWYEGNK